MNYERAYAISVLQEKKEMLQAIGPATDVPERYRKQVAILDDLIGRLSQPFPLNPFL